MRHDHRRITLLAANVRTPDRDWDDSPFASTRIVFVHSFKVLRYAIAGGVDDMRLDIERVVIDNAATPAEFLELLATLPPNFGGDVLLIADGGGSYLSSPGRGDGRVLYSVSDADVRFYLETHELVTGKVVLRQTA